jgi:pectate lyase
MTAQTVGSAPARPMSWIQAARRFADAALAYTRDRFGPYASPLFADGLDITTGEPVTWHVNGEEWILSNWASQQVFMRTLIALTLVTDDRHYRDVAEDTAHYVLEHLRYQRLLSWGGHMAYDLALKRTIYAPDKGPVHELKCHYPFYDLMWAVDPVITRDYIEAMWASHVQNFDTLEFSRHGTPVGARHSGLSLWDRPYLHEPVPFTGKGLTFINAGSDLIYAAALLSNVSGDLAPLTWAKRLAARYVEVRHPKTQLGGYQFSVSVLPGPRGRGDRAVAQFGEQLKAHAPTEVTLCVARQIRTIVGSTAINKMLLSERLGPSGAEFKNWAIEDLLAYARWSYDPTNHAFDPVLTDGTRLGGLILAESGYYGRRGDALGPLPADSLLLWSYALAYRLAGTRELWTMVQSLLERCGTPRARRNPDPIAVFAFLELYRATRDPAFLATASSIGDTLVERQTASGFFVPCPDCRYAKVDALEPLALLHLANAYRTQPAELPWYWASRAFFGAAYENRGHAIDQQLFYTCRLEEE